MVVEGVVELVLSESRAGAGQLGDMYTHQYRNVRTDLILASSLISQSPEVRMG